MKNELAKSESRALLDCSGLCCSLQLVEARSKLDKMQIGETLEVVAKCPSTEKDMELLTKLKSYELIKKWKEDEFQHFLI
ncbi:MAG: sulfurtransferase TusA family protein, partial [Candidatus Bathyarchaeota archaeon]